jgi:hypothetical protein
MEVISGIGRGVVACLRWGAWKWCRRCLWWIVVDYAIKKAFGKRGIPVVYDCSVALWSERDASFGW